MYRIIILLFITLYINQAEAHVCDDVLMHDPIKIRTDVQTVLMTKEGEFKVLLRNDYRAPIHNVSIIVPENLFDIRITPTLIESVLPGQEVYFSVKITVPEDVRPGAYPLLMKVDALEFEITRDIQLTLQVEERKTVIEILPEDIPVAISVFPSVIEIEPARSMEIRVYVRNGHTESIHNLSLFVNESKFRVNITPKIIEELRAGDKTYFVVDLFVPTDIELGDYMLAMEVDAHEFAVRRGVSVIVRVGEVREEITYLYLLIVSFLIFLLIWRSLKLGYIKRIKGTF